MIYGVFAAAMIGGYQYFARRGEKRATGLFDPMWITNICLLLDQGRVIDEYLHLQRICSGIIVIRMPLQSFFYKNMPESFAAGKFI